MDAAPKPKAQALTETAFHLLLERLDGDRGRAGEKYERLRKKLLKFFTYEGTGFPEDGADEAINRVARKLENGEEIEEVDRYALGVARLLLKEMAQRQRVARAALVEVLRQSEAASAREQAEARIAALQRCLERLPPEGRDLVISYYQGERNAKIENRKRLADQHHIPLNALRNRVFRLRDRLERCLERANDSGTGAR